ncbi:MAG: tetratricopeptide repeat protein, partial [Omnitrophica bacterium]|nr:tetratricopeptide repeat protein [Candidatus Omnitrophota bacterium]
AAELIEDAEIFEHLGDIYQAKGDLKKARQIYERALELEPERKTAQERLERLNNRKEEKALR